MSKQPPPAPTVSAVGPCPTVIQIVGRPGTGSLPSTIAPPDHPLHGLINYLETGVLPRSQKKARRILLESSDYALIDGLLWHSRVAKSKRTKQLDHYQLVLPDTMIKTVVQLYHDSPMSGHAGVTDTLDRVREHYFFQRMGPLITDYVR